MWDKPEYKLETLAGNYSVWNMELVPTDNSPKPKQFPQTVHFQLFLMRQVQANMSLVVSWWI